MAGRQSKHEEEKKKEREREEKEERKREENEEENVYLKEWNENSSQELDLLVTIFIVNRYIQCFVQVFHSTMFICSRSLRVNVQGKKEGKKVRKKKREGQIKGLIEDKREREREREREKERERDESEKGSLEQENS